MQGTVPQPERHAHATAIFRGVSAPRQPDSAAGDVKLSAVEPGYGIDVQQPPEPLAVRTIPVADPGDLVAQFPQAAGVAWIHHGDGLVGWGETARITLPAGEDRFTAGEKWLRALFEGAQVDDQVGEPGCGLVAFGSFTFDSASDGSVLVVPAAIIGRRHGRSWLTTITPAGRPASPQAGRVPQAPPDSLTTPGELRWHDGSLSAPDWERAVAAAVARIRAGQLGKVVLARDLFATASQDIDIRVMLHRLAGRYPDCYTFACGNLVGATPELLIRRQDAEISSLVLGGTAPRGRDATEDAALGTALLASAKELEEHQYAVVGVRSALASRCDELEVDASPSLVRFANVQHLATWISGRLAGAEANGNHSVLALADALHYTPAVCGTPAETAMELIRDLEGMDRGRYAGPVGWIDARGNGEWGIALRCAEVDGRRARLFAGCGIVAGSDPAAELAETVTKFAPMRYALEA
jgi:menaquinone-specific isochorismate synthase